MLNLFGSNKKSVQITPIGAVTAVGGLVTQGKHRLPANRRKAIDPGHPIVDGPHYLDVLGALHSCIAPDWYLEIGTFEGASLKLCQSNFIAVDPDLKVKDFTFGDVVRGHFFQQTSDAFFASDFLERNAIRPGLGFLDGMHLSEYLLRDFINFERAAAPGAVAVLHDCLPGNALMEDRHWDLSKTDMWTGDVWKVLLALLDMRPDLQIHVLDAYPTGLVVVRGLDPENATLTRNFDAFDRKMRNLRLGDYGVDAYYARFEIQSSYHFIESLQSPAAQTQAEGT